MGLVTDKMSLSEQLDFSDGLTLRILRGAEEDGKELHPPISITGIPLPKAQGPLV
jgi:hypothetical protein